MGMFDKDKEIGVILQNWVKDGSPFILWDARIIREDFPTALGNAVQSELTVSKLDAPGDEYRVTTLASAIAAKVRESEPSDFPAVVQTAHVDSKWGRDALVLSYLKPYTGRRDTRNATQESMPHATAEAPPVPTETDDIPF